MKSGRPFLKTATRTGLRWLYFVHRWLGVAACLFFAMWFGSGLVMMYVPFPSLTAQERLAHAPPIDWSKVKVGPTAALAAAGFDRFPERLRLEMMGPEPVYRMAGDADRATVSAETGGRITAVDEMRALQAARAFAPGARPTLSGVIARDQWTVAGGYDRTRPFYLFDLHDGLGGRLYISTRTGEAALETDARERFWNWLGSVPHWIYPTALRQHQPAWRQVILWTSGIGVVSAVTGVWIGLLRVRLRRRSAAHPISPYRGWMKWHHWAGLLGGLFLTTWIFSGWLSVNPFRWFDRPSVEADALARYAGQTAPRMDANVARLAAAGQGAANVEFAWAQGQPIAALRARNGRTTVIDTRTGAPAGLTDARLFAAAAALVPQARIVGRERLIAEDDYWYSHSDDRPLPVLRVRFDDPKQSWIYLDPATAEVLDIDNASSRAYRWWFSGLHDLDFRFLLHNRPAWDLAVWLLATGGMITSISGVVIGWRRLTRKKLPGAASWRSRKGVHIRVP